MAHSPLQVKTGKCAQCGGKGEVVTITGSEYWVCRSCALNNLFSLIELMGCKVVLGSITPTGRDQLLCSSASGAIPDGAGREGEGV
jgi:hypothetical protein